MFLKIRKKINDKFKVKLKAFPSKKQKKEGSNLFISYNYSILFTSFVLLYLTIHIYFYFEGLTYSDEVTKMGYDMENYKQFLEDFKKFGIIAAILLIITYIYAIVMFVLHADGKSYRRESIDALLINFAYFITLMSSLYIKGYDLDGIVYVSFLLFVPIIIFIYLQFCRKISFKVSSYGSTTAKIFSILLITYITEHIDDIIFSSILARNDIQSKYKQKTKILIEAEKKKILNKINNDSSIIISDIYLENGNTAHIIIKNLKTI